MKYFYFFFLNLFLWISSAFAETYMDRLTFNYVTTVPQRYERNVYDLTMYLTKPYRDDYDKARAIAYYIASHMLYDEYQYNNGGPTKLVQRTKPEDLLKTRVGICGDFANLFALMCQKAGISAGVVSGYVMQAQQLSTARSRRNAAHAWNYFIYRHKKIYVDPTFMATGKTGHEKYITKWSREQAISKIEKNTKFSNHVYMVNAFYFDFDYAQEKTRWGLRRVVN